MICLGRKGALSLNGEGVGACSSVGFYWVYLHRNTRHNVKLINHCQAVMIKQYITFKELSGLILSQDQIKGHKTLGKQTHSVLGPLSFKLRVLAKQVSEDFMHSFLGLIALGNPPFPAQGLTHLQHCFRLKALFQA